MGYWINVLEAVDRRTRMTTTGAEIVTTFYVEPASASPIVVSCLLGSVTGNTTSDTRVLPAADYEYPFMHCVEAHKTATDRRAVASSPALLLNNKNIGNSDTVSAITAALANPIIFDGPQS